MSDGIIARIIPLAASAYTGTSGYWGINANFPAANLADPQPKTVVQGNTGTGFIGVVVDIDFGRSVDFDGLAVIGTNLSTASGFWDVFSSGDGVPLPALGSETSFNRLPFTGVNGAFGVAPTTRAATRSAVVFGSTIARRYLRVYLRDLPASNPDGVVRAGIIAPLQTVPLAFNYELGSGRKPEDQSVIRTLPGGETAIERGGRTPVWRATWSNITDAEMRSLWALLNEIGTGAPLIICEDPEATAGQNERIHYGLLSSLDFNERTQADKQRIDLTIREMI